MRTNVLNGQVRAKALTKRMITRQAKVDGGGAIASAMRTIETEKAGLVALAAALEGDLHDAFREVAGYAGTSAELLHEFIRRWWTQYGGTPAAGLTKLIMSEAANFPDLAQYYQDEVVQPSHELVRRIVQRGIARKEFRAIDLTLASHLIVAPLVQMVTWRFSLAPCCPATQMPDPLKLLDMHADMAVRGLKI